MNLVTINNLLIILIINKYENLLSKEKLKEYYKLQRLERILLNITREQKAQLVYYMEKKLKKLEKQILIFITF